MDTRKIGVELLVIAFTVQISALSVDEGYAVTIMCPLDDSITYPTWTGPETLAEPLMTSNSFNEPEIEWEANNHDIKITKAMLKHEGTYTCASSNGLEKELYLTVNYFERPQMHIITENNGKTTLTCGAYSKPELRIPIHLRASGNAIVSNPNSTAKYDGCQPDPNYNNRSYCELTAIWYISKEDNGLKQECSFVHNGTLRVELEKKVHFKFPPTVVKITGNKPITEGPTLNLNCSTDSSYPVSTLVWKTNNDVIQNDAEPIVMDAQYNGKSISQILSLNVSNDMKGQRVSCCVADLCDSVALNINITSIICTAVDVKKYNAVTIPCPLDIQYPTWTGPEGLADPLTDGQTINEPGIKWINNKDLLIEKALLKHEGNYTCSDGNGNNRTVEVDVKDRRSFKVSGRFTPATIENTTTVLTCWCSADPTCKIIPHTFTHIRPGKKVNYNSVITFKPCVQDPDNDTMTMCSVEAVMRVSKEDNGLKMSCDVEYENATVLTIFPKVIFEFPPTVVNISAELKQSKLILNCSTDSSNPVSYITWRRGSSDELYASDVIRSSYESYVMDAEYNGKNITQAIDIEPEKIEKGEKVFCCYQRNNKQICDSIALESYQILVSGAGVVTTWLTVLLVGVAFMAV